MSVAFRRESDDEHIEPHFELPLPAGRNLVTARGFDQIAAKAVELEDMQRATTDLEELKRIARELRYWHTRRATAEIAAPPTGDEVAFGSHVRLRHAGRERIVQIVGHDEADPARDTVSFTSPLARALIGAVAGEQVVVGGRSGSVEILAVGASVT